MNADKSSGVIGRRGRIIRGLKACEVVLNNFEAE